MLGPHLHLSALCTTPNSNPQPPVDAPIAVVAAGTHTASAAAVRARSRSAARHAAAVRDDYDDDGDDEDPVPPVEDAEGGDYCEPDAYAGPHDPPRRLTTGSGSGGALGGARRGRPRAFSHVLFPTVYDAKAQRSPRLARPSPGAARGAAAFVQELATQLATAQMSCAQLEHLLRLLPLHVSGLRVEVLVLLFGRLADLWAVNGVLWALSLSERRAAVARLGWLNLFDPMAPDGPFLLNLASHEERWVWTGGGGGEGGTVAQADNAHYVRGAGPSRISWCSSR